MAGCEEKPKNEVSQPAASYMIGIIVTIENGSLLVVGDVTEEDLNTLSPQEIIDKYQDGAWFGVGELAKEVEKGDKVKVWYDAMNLSLPAYGEAVKIELL